MKSHDISDEPLPESRAAREGPGGRVPLWALAPPPFPVRHPVPAELGTGASLFDLLSELDAGGPVIDVHRMRPGWRELWSRIEQGLRALDYHEGTIRGYRVALRGLARWFHRPPHELTSGAVRGYMLHRIDRGVGAAALAAWLSAARTCLDRLAGMAVVRDLQAPRRTAPPSRTLPSVAEMKRLFQSVSGLRDKLFVSLLYACGLRLAECCRLRWSDLDPETCQVQIRASGSRSPRASPFPPALAGLVRLGREGAAAAHVFPGARRGEHLTPRGAQRLLARAVSRARLDPRITPRTLRHAFVAHMVAAAATK